MDFLATFTLIVISLYIVVLFLFSLLPSALRVEEKEPANPCQPPHQTFRTAHIATLVRVCPARTSLSQAIN